MTSSHPVIHSHLPVIPLARSLWERLHKRDPKNASVKAAPLVFLLCLFLLLAPESAHAADIFVRPKSAQIPPQNTPPVVDVPELEDIPAKPAENTPPPSSMKDFSNAYYKNCMAQDHPILKGESLKLLCGCTAAKLPEAMTIPQLQAMATSTAEGDLQRSRMMMFVYAPCMEHPTKALILDQCMGDPKVRNGLKHANRVCECLGDEMGKFMKERGPRVIEGALRRNVKDLDPLGSLMQSKAFDKASQAALQDCMALYELGQAYQ